MCPLLNKTVVFTEDFGIIPKGTIVYCYAYDKERDSVYTYMREPILNMNNFNFGLSTLLEYTRVI